jgi:hypothetical protein
MNGRASWTPSPLATLIFPILAPSLWESSDVAICYVSLD